MMTRSALFLPRCFLLATLVVVSSSCREDVLGPLNNTVFVLQTVDDVALPATVVDDFGGLAWVVVADTIWLEGGSKWRRRGIQEREEGVGGDPLDWQLEGTVVRQGGLLILEHDCPDADCIAPDRVTETSAGLQMDETFLHAGRRLIFRPI